MVFSDQGCRLRFPIKISFYLEEKRETQVGIVEILLIGVALSADAMSVTVCNLLANPRLSWSRAMTMPIAFGLFQGIMPVIGFFAGSLAASIIESYAGIVAFLILGFIGGKMIWDGFRDEGEGDQEEGLSIAMLLMQAVATSIDAFAVGVSFAASGLSIVFSSSVICICTFVLCCAMLFAGRKVGGCLGKYSQIIGGIVLVGIGLKELLF